MTDKIARGQCTVITYRLKQTVPPSEVVEALYGILSEHALTHQSCLWRLSRQIIEYEADGVFHSNREKNAILSICRQYPALSRYYRLLRHDQGEGHIREDCVLTNYDEDALTSESEDAEPIIRELVHKIPRPYGVNEFEIILDGIDFLKCGREIACLRASRSGFGSPVGSYIGYSREVYGSEKHAYIQFAIVHEGGQNIDPFRALFHAFAERIPGTYEGTEVVDV